MKNNIIFNFEKNVLEKRTGLITILIFCFLLSCNYSAKKEDTGNQLDLEQDVSNIPEYHKSPNAAYKRDSLFIISTIWQFIEKQVSPFQFYKTFNIPFNRIRVDVDTIMYSPDSLKLFAFVIETSPESEHNNKKNYSSGNSLIGFRSNSKTYWTIYNFDQFSTGGFRKYNSVRKLFREYYFGEGNFKNDAEYIWDSIKQIKTSAKFGYNLNEVHFWDSSLVWIKGARIPGYYNFQTTGNVKPGDENSILVIPHLDYPDSLIKMF